eukprot:353561-Chlamydomonas_euryale.AAC.7
MNSWTHPSWQLITQELLCLRQPPLMSRRFCCAMLGSSVQRLCYTYIDSANSVVNLSASFKFFALESHWHQSAAYRRAAHS